MIPADVPAVAELERATFSTPWQEKTFEQLLDRSSGVEVWVAEGLPGGGDVSPDDRLPEALERDGDANVGPSVLGYAVLWIAADQGELANLAVRSEARGLGLGGRLLDRILHRCRERGVTAIYLEVRSSNEVARSLYEGRGFRTVGMRKGYYSGPREDARVMMLGLSAVETESRP